MSAEEPTPREGGHVGVRRSIKGTQWEPQQMELVYWPGMSSAEDTAPCQCECSSGGFCGGCGHAGCGRRARVY